MNPTCAFLQHLIQTSPSWRVSPDTLFFTPFHLTINRWYSIRLWKNDCEEWDRKGKRISCHNFPCRLETTLLWILIFRNLISSTRSTSTTFDEVLFVQLDIEWKKRYRNRYTAWKASLLSVKRQEVRGSTTSSLHPYPQILSNISRVHSFACLFAVIHTFLLPHLLSFQVHGTAFHISPHVVWEEVREKTASFTSKSDSLPHL